MNITEKMPQINKQYQCLICNTNPDQKSHHDAHLKTNKHTAEKKIKKLELEKETEEALIKKYNTSDIDKIIKSLEKHEITQTNEFEKKKKTNKLIFDINQNPDDQQYSKICDQGFKDTFLSFVGRMHNLLRGGAVTGDDALDDILYTLMLCYLEKNNKIEEFGMNDFKNYQAEDDFYEDEFNEYKKFLKISVLKESEELIRPSQYQNDIETCAVVKCGILLKQHPKTKNLIVKKDFFHCKDGKVLHQLFKECYNFVFQNILETKKNNVITHQHDIFNNLDIIGLGYEYINSKHGGNGGTSKEMGQYFTERPLMYMCFQLIENQDLKDLGINNDSVIGDEFCATFGFPIFLRKFLQQKEDIKIKTENIRGIEFHERLSKFALMNCLFSMGTCDNVKNENSFITDVTPHLDISVHNVPFGKSMMPHIIKKKYENLKNPDKPKIEEYIPFPDKKIDAILSSQVVLYKTKKMGLMIIKDGEETSGKSNDKYRKWFMENCIIKKIMKIPSGAFTNTGTKTVCIYFIKKEGKQTENIQFLQLSDNGEQINEICNVSMEDMKQNNYSWDPNTYILDEEMENMMKKSTCEWKNLGDFVEIELGERITKKENIINGNYYVYGGGDKNDNFKVNKFNRNNFTCKISRFAASINNCVILLNKSYWLNDSGFTIKSKNENILINKFIFYYLKYFMINNIVNFKKLYRGSGQQNIDFEQFKLLNIPTPPLPIQNTTVQILDDLSQQKQLLIDRKDGIERQMKYYFESQIKKNRDEIELKKLEEIIQINIGSTPDTRNKLLWNNGQYPWITVSELKNNLIPIIESKKKLTNEAIEKCNPKLVKQGTILMSFKLSIGKLGIAGCDLYTNEAILHINTNNDELNRYLYYHMLSISIDKTASGCMGGGSLNKEKLKVLNIYIQQNPEKQTQIVEFLDNLENQKNNIDQYIEEIDSIMKDTLEMSYQ